MSMACGRELPGEHWVVLGGLQPVDTGADGAGRQGPMGWPGRRCTAFGGDRRELPEFRTVRGAAARRCPGCSRAQNRRRLTRRAVRREVRRATLRDPNMSSSFVSACLPVLQGVQFLGLLGRGQPNLHQVERADEPVTDPEAARPEDRVP
jgi:hypothetical protein